MLQKLSEILHTVDPEKSGEEKLSQSRLYLFITFIVMIGIIIAQFFVSYDADTMSTGLEYLLYLILIFSGYSISGKGMATFQKIKQ